MIPVAVLLDSGSALLKLSSTLVYLPLNVFLGTQNGPQKTFIVIVILNVNACLFVLDEGDQIQQTLTYEKILKE